MARMTMTKAMKHYAPTFEETFERFLSNRKAKGSSDKTLQTYHYHFRAISKYLDADKDIDLITKTDLEQMLADMRDAGLSSNSINSYTRTLKSFFSWCNEEEITTLNLRLYKAEETVKDTYTDAELKRLLKKPKMRSTTFCEYRNWVIINLLLNSGCRAATIRSFLVKDVNLNNATITYRHTKNKSIQIVPLCSEILNVLFAGKINKKKTKYVIISTYKAALEGNIWKIEKNSAICFTVHFMNRFQIPQSSDSSRKKFAHGFKIIYHQDCIVIGL